MAKDSEKDKNKSKDDDGSETQPMNKRTPGKKGRSWRGDSADFSEEESDN